jgi:hypothetical protein
MFEHAFAECVFKKEPGEMVYAPVEDFFRAHCNFILHCCVGDVDFKVHDSIIYFIEEFIAILAMEGYELDFSVRKNRSYFTVRDVRLTRSGLELMSEGYDSPEGSE